MVTGKPLDSHLTMRQIIGLRFASDEELPNLAKKAWMKNYPKRRLKSRSKTGEVITIVYKTA